MNCPVGPEYAKPRITLPRTGMAAEVKFTQQCSPAAKGTAAMAKVYSADVEMSPPVQSVAGGRSPAAIDTPRTALRLSDSISY